MGVMAVRVCGFERGEFDLISVSLFLLLYIITNKPCF